LYVYHTFIDGNCEVFLSTVVVSIDERVMSNSFLVDEVGTELLGILLTF